MKKITYSGPDMRTRGNYGEWVQEGLLIETPKEAEDYRVPVGKISVSDAAFGNIAFENTKEWYTHYE